MKYSLKNQFKHLLKEESNTFKSNVSLERVSSQSKIYYGTFDSTSLSLWNEKDGSGGRGEYTVASHFLKTSLENRSNFKRSNTSVFFKKLNSIDSFVKGTGIILDLENDAFETDLKAKLSEFGIELIEISDNAISSIKEKKSSSHKFKIKTDKESASTLSTAIRLINKTIFLRSIEGNKEKPFSPDDYAIYDLINSVTTSGEKSKSTDVYIENRFILKSKDIIVISESLISLPCIQSIWSKEKISP